MQLASRSVGVEEVPASSSILEPLSTFKVPQSFSTLLIEYIRRGQYSYPGEPTHGNQACSLAIIGCYLSAVRHLPELN